MYKIQRSRLFFKWVAMKRIEFARSFGFSRLATVAGLGLCAAAQAPAPAAAGQSGTWLESLPKSFRTSVLWCADHEEGTLYDWHYDNPDMAGGGVFNTGSENEAVARATSDFSFSGRFAVETTIRNAVQCRNGDKAVRLMRWTDKPWDQGGKLFPSSAYYSTWMLIPHVYDPSPKPGDGGWWNVFQFKSKDAQGVSQPTLVINIGYDPARGAMMMYLHSKVNRPASQAFSRPFILANRWFHVEAFVKQSAPNRPNGELAVWIDGKRVFQRRGLVTCLTNRSLIWGIGNYTGHIAGGPVEGEATVYFDDALVSRLPASVYARGRATTGE